MKTLKMIFFFMVFGLTTNAQNIDLKNGLVGYWPFNGNANDESGNGNNGTVYGATLTIDKNGNSNSAYRFNGNNAYIKIPDRAYNNFYSYSLTFTFKLGDNSQETIISKQHNGVNSIGVLSIGYGASTQKGSGGVLYFHPQNKIGTSTCNTKLATGKYYNVTLTFSNSSLKTYVDGLLVCSQSGDYSIPNDLNSSGTAIGAWLSDGGGKYFNGIIDEVRIYNRALNELEINELSNNETNIVSENSSFENNNNSSYVSNNVIKNIDKKEINLTIPFSKEFLLIEKQDLNKFETSVIKKQAKKGDLASLVTYGDMFYYGYDKIERNEVEAIINYKKAADQGNALAQYKLATIYRQNGATVSDAIKYYNMAIEQNYEPAVYDLAILYLNGSGGISKDYSKAKELLQKIPSNMKAKTELGKLYLSSDITTFNLKADLQMAKSLFQDANQIGIFNEWLNRLDNFGKFRYALSKMPTLINGINTEIDFKNETQLKALIDQLNLQSEVLGNEKIKKYTYDLIDNLEVVNSTISKQYEDENYQVAIKSKSPTKLKAFVNRFPNSTYRKSALDEITNLDNEKFKQANSNNTVYSYQQYLDLFPLGLNADEARNKIKQIEQEEKLALEKQQEEERQAKIKAQQDKANAEYEYEQNRKNSITNASVGGRLCFSQGWTRTESFFFMPYTAANYTMSIICFIERKEGENYQVRIADVSSSKSGEYSSPNINGVKVSKGDVIWVKPLNDSKWHKCD